MEQAYYERITRQTQVRRLLQKAVLNLCQKNYAACAPNLEVDGIICISFPDCPDQHVVKIHEKIQLDDVRSGTSYDRTADENEDISNSLPDSGMYIVRNEAKGALEDRDSMQNSYLDVKNGITHLNSSGNSVFPKMQPISSKSSKTLDSDSHASKSKRKMFKVVQRKRNTPEELEVLSDSSEEMISTNSSNDPNKDINSYEYTPCHEKETDKTLSPNQKKANFCETVQDGYVVVKVEENFEDEVVDHGRPEHTLHDKNSQTVDKHNMKFDCEMQPSRQWIQLPSQDDEESVSGARESLITIDGRINEHSEEYASNSRNCSAMNDDENHENGNYAVRRSVAQIDLSQMSDYHNQSSVHIDEHYESFDYHGKDFQIGNSSVFPKSTSNNENRQFPLYTESILRKNRSSPNKGTKTLDNLFFNKCAKEQLKMNLNKKKESNMIELPFTNQQNEKQVNMIDLQSTTTNDASEMKLPVSLSVNLNKLISTHAAKEKKYFCRHCGKGFTLKCTRSRHEKTICGGGGEGQYRCHICLKVFTRSDSRCRHLWKTHGVKSTNEVTAMC